MAKQKSKSTKFGSTATAHSPISSAAVEKTKELFPATGPVGFQLDAAKKVTDPNLRKLSPVQPTSVVMSAASASNTVQGPASIVELARALDVDNNGPQLMFEFVYNNIEWEPGWGVQKGGLGALLDGMGNSFDQSLLLAELLREAGYTANIIHGTIRLTEDEYKDWWNVTSIWGAQSYCANQFIPIVTAPTWTGTEWYMDIRHVWVEWDDSGTKYQFDPSYKEYTRKAAMSNLATALGYTASTYKSNYESGATIDAGGDYVYDMNRANIRSDMETFTDNLIDYIKANDIGSAKKGTATVDDVLGGQEIVPVTLPVLDTSLPHQQPGDSPTVWTGDVPSSYKATLQVQFPNWNNPGTWDFTYQTTADNLAGKRLTLWYDGSLVPKLYLDGTVVATGLAQGTGTWTSIYLTVTHPAHAASNYPLSWQKFYQTNWQWWQSFIYAGSYYLIANAWGNLGRGQYDSHLEKAAKEIAAGGSATSEAVLGEQLAAAFFLWAGQNSKIADLINRIKNCHTVYNHQIGIVSYDGGGDGTTGIDLGGVSGSSTNLANDTTQTPINDRLLGMHGVALEGAFSSQMTGAKPIGTNTTAIIDQANRTMRATIGGTVTTSDVLTITVTDSDLSGGSKSVNYTVVGGDTLTTIATGLKDAINADSDLDGINVKATSSGAVVTIISGSKNQTSYSKSLSGGATETITLAFDRIYKGTSSNWNTGTNVQSTLVGNGFNSTDMSNIYNWYIQWGTNVVIEDHPSNIRGKWDAWSYWGFPSAGAFGITNASLKGDPGPEGDPSKKDPKSKNKNKNEKNDPLDFFTGDFLYRNEDISLGSGEYPYKLSFGRFYDSSRRFIDGPLGYGWRHSYSVSAQIGSDGFLAMGEQNAIHAAASIANLYVNADLASDTALPVAKLVAMTIADNWWMEQIVDNTVIVQFPEHSEIYVKLPDGTYVSQNSVSNSLSLSSGLYTVKTPQQIAYNFNSSGQLSTIVFPEGVTITLTYSSGKLSTISNGLGRTLTVTHTGDRITSVSDGTGRSISYTIDTNGNLAKFTDANSKDTTYEYVSTGLMTKFFRPANPTSPIVTNTYDTLGRVKEQKDGDNNIWKYFLAGARSTEEDPLGNLSVTYFNAFGNPLSEIDQNDKKTVFEYDGLQRVIKETLPEGNSTVWTYDANNNILTATAIAKSGSGLSDIVNTFTYNSTWNKVATAKDGLNRTTTYTYDGTKGYLTKIEKPAVGGSTPTINMTYNSRGQLLTHTDETGIVTKFNYDSTTEKLTSFVEDEGTGRLNLTTSYGHDSKGDITSVTDARGNQTTFEYDVLRQLKKQTDPSPLSYQTKFTYNENGFLTKLERETGDVSNPWQTVDYIRSVMGQVTKITDPSSNDTLFEYDARRQLKKETDAELRVTEYTYDSVGRLSTVKDPSLTIADTRTYTDNGLIASIKDASNNTTTFSYDGHDRLDKTTYPNSDYEQNSSYDANGNILTFRTRSGNNITFTYDELNRVKTRAPASQPTVTLTYDLAGRLTKASKPVASGDPSSGDFEFFYDGAGRFYKEKYPDAKVVEHEHDENGNVIKTTWPDSYYVERVYDKVNRLTDVKLNGNTSSAAAILYDKLSRRTKLTFGNGVVADYTYELDDDLKTLVHTFSGSSLTLTLAYNKIHEMTSQQMSDGQFMWHPAAAGTTTYASANNMNQYPTVGGNTFTYNFNGCLTGDGTWTFGYDTENHLTSASKTGTSASYVYDPVHRQAQKDVGGTKTRFIYDLLRRIAEYDGSGNLVTRFVYGVDLDEMLLEVDSAGTITYYSNNHQNSVIAVTPSTGVVSNRYDYSPFGLSGSMSGTSHGFTGQRFDSETGLYYYKARYYSPEIGRFLQPDPIGYGAGDLNLYGYTGNDPIGFIDPLGLEGASTGHHAGIGQSNGVDAGDSGGVTTTSTPVQSSSNPKHAGFRKGTTRSTRTTTDGRNIIQSFDYPELVELTPDPPPPPTTVVPIPGPLDGDGKGNKGKGDKGKSNKGDFKPPKVETKVKGKIIPKNKGKGTKEINPKLTDGEDK